MISTGLSLCSSFLFSWGVRQSITLRLRGKGMPLAGFLSSLKISSRSLILDPKNRRWSVMSMAVLILTVVQTPCWSSLISPSQMDFEAPLNGTEIDLTNPRLQSLQSTGKLDYCVIDTTNIASFYVGQTESGYSALKGDMDLQATLTLMDQTFNLATGGTLPQTFDPVNTTSWFVGTNITHIPSNIESVVDLPESLDFSSYTAKQQGFTADVSCEFQALPNDTTIQFFAAQDWNGGIQRTLSLYQMNSTCVPPAVSVPDGPVSYTEAYIAGDPNYILMVACGGESDAYTLIFRGAGRYGFMDTMVCTVAPKVTSVQVDYSATGTINSKQLTDGDPVDVNGPAGLSAITTIYEMQSFAQGTTTNVVGDQIIAVMNEVDPDDVHGGAPSTNGPFTSDPNTTTRVLSLNGNIAFLATNSSPSTTTAFSMPVPCHPPSLHSTLARFRW